MAGWRVGFVVGNEKLVGALKRIKSWLDYGMFAPIQIAATVALDGPQDCVDEIVSKYEKRRDVMLKTFAEAGWVMDKPNAYYVYMGKDSRKSSTLRKFRIL